ncbi:MAG: helix-turn-helix transcriptional regulator [Nibricoccus sp.]
MDLIFKALADSSRRLLLDRLHVQDGQTLRALCGDLDMTRQAVTKHLVVLEAAGLVTTTWQGREKLHHLNPSPLSRITTDWIKKYEGHQPAKVAMRVATSTINRIPPAPAPTEIDGESRWTNL